MTEVLPAPIIRLASSADIVSLISSTQSFTHDATKGTQIHATPAITGSQVNKDLKSKTVRLIATGYAPFGKPLGEEQVVEPVVAVVGEDKVLKLFQADTGKVFYERTLIKKASVISIEEDGSVIVSDKNGDVFSYPFVDDNFESANVPKTIPVRPDPTALAGDPSLNPDAKLLLGHVSANTAHLITQDGKHIITADRDEHIRVSRYPESYVVVRFLFGHKQFVSSLCLLPSHPDLLLSAGGEPNILVHSWSTGTLIRQIPILPSIIPFRTVRSAMRRAPGRIRRAQKAEEERLEQEGKLEELQKIRSKRDDDLAGRHVKTRGLSEEEWKTSVRGYVLPEGDGVCVSKMEVVGESVIFFSEGCSSVHSIPIEHVVAPLSVLSSVNSLALPSPILDFCPLPASSSSGVPILISTDPAWEQRSDGGRTFFPTNVTETWMSLKRKQKREMKAGGMRDVTMGEPVENEITEEAIAKMSQRALRVVRIQQDGSLEDASDAYKEYLDNFTIPTAPVDQVLAIPLYNDLSFYPKWQSEEDEDEVGENDVVQTTLAESGGNNRKRALGRLKAKGIEVKNLRKAKPNKKKKDEVKEQEVTGTEIDEPMEQDDAEEMMNA